MTIEEYLRALEHYAKTLDLPKTWYQVVLVVDKADGTMGASCNSTAAIHDSRVICERYLESLRHGAYLKIEPEKTQ